MESSKTSERNGAGVEENLLTVETIDIESPLSNPPGLSPKSKQKQATIKRIAQGLEIVLITENVNQLKFILLTKGHHPFYSLVIGLLCASISIQIAIGLCILCIGPLSINKKAHRSRAKILNVLVNTFIFLVFVINIFISSLVIQHDAASFGEPGNKLSEVAGQDNGDRGVG